MFGNIDRSRKITYTAAFIALISLGSWISIPFVPVPFTLQTFFIMLAGAVMKRSAVVPVVLYILLGALGLPLFHNGLAGAGVLLGPTGGYLIGFIPAVLVVGLAYEHQSRLFRAGGLAAATIVIYACGIGGLMYSARLDLAPAVIAGVLPFIPGDAVKAGAACLVADRLS